MDLVICCSNSLVEKALIIDGTALKHAFDPACRRLFLEVACQCRAVLCCRVSPLQKAKVVELVRRRAHALCLAIGDGANDVSMLQAADVGVGIVGQEGMQAMMNSDYAVTQFSHLRRLLLVHGHWAYGRTATVVLGSLYKNMAFVLLLFWYQFYCGFTAQFIYDYIYLLLFNLLLTVAPVIAAGCFDRDLEAGTLCLLPALYHAQRGCYSMRRFLLVCLEAFWHSLACFFIPLLAYRGQPLDVWGHVEDRTTLGTIMALTVITCCNLQVGGWTRAWSWPVWFAQIGSLALLLLVTVLTGIVPTTTLYGALNLVAQPRFYATLVLTFSWALLPLLIVKYIQAWCWQPSDIDLMREVEKYGVGWEELLPKEEQSEVEEKTLSELEPLRLSRPFDEEEDEVEMVTAPSNLIPTPSKPSLLERIRQVGTGRPSREMLEGHRRRRMALLNLRTGRYEQLRGYAFSG